jgi:NAD(P)-dependent dehydrogenase (short-subunit alcohol dehydrogenase family)
MAITTPIQSMKDAFSVKGMNVVVTGGNRGIGLGIATAFAQGGANVAILCRKVEKGIAEAEELRKNGVKCECIACDVSNLDSVKAAVAQVLEQFGTIDVLVNNAGIAPVSRLIDDENLQDWRASFETNLHGPANTIHVVAPHMIQNGGGSIINISSIAGQAVVSAMDHPKPGYHCSKAALDQLTKYMAMELRGTGIRVNCIAPGLTHSELDIYLPKTIYDFVDNVLPTRRFSDPIEIGAGCVYLASPAGAQVNGVILSIDAGKLLVD